MKGKSGWHTTAASAVWHACKFPMMSSPSARLLNSSWDHALPVNATAVNCRRPIDPVPAAVSVCSQPAERWSAVSDGGEDQGAEGEEFMGHEEGGRIIASVLERAVLPRARARWWLSC